MFDRQKKRAQYEKIGEKHQEEEEMFPFELQENTNTTVYAEYAETQDANLLDTVNNSYSEEIAGNKVQVIEKESGSTVRKITILYLLILAAVVVIGSLMIRSPMQKKVLFPDQPTPSPSFSSPPINTVTSTFNSKSTPSSAPSSSFSPKFPSVAPSFKFIGTMSLKLDYGGTFNRIKTLELGCIHAMKHHYELFVIEGPWFDILPLLDIESLKTRCALVNNRKSKRVALKASTVFYMDHVYKRTLVDSMVLIPGKRIREEVEKWLSDTFDPEKTLIGVHDRWMEGTCAMRMRQYCKVDTERETVEIDHEICFMDGHLVQRIARDMGIKENYEVFIASDHERERDWTPLGSAAKHPPESWSVLHDAWMLAHVDMLIQIPVSSICMTVKMWLRNLKDGKAKVYTDHCEYFNRTNS